MAADFVRSYNSQKWLQVSENWLNLNRGEKWYQLLNHDTYCLVQQQSFTLSSIWLNTFSINRLRALVFSKSVSVKRRLSLQTGCKMLTEYKMCEGVSIEQKQKKKMKILLWVYICEFRTSFLTAISDFIAHRRLFVLIRQTPCAADCLQDSKIIMLASCAEELAAHSKTGEWPYTDATCWDSITSFNMVGHNMLSSFEHHVRTCWAMLDRVARCWKKFHICQTFHPACLRMSQGISFIPPK